MSDLEEVGTVRRFEIAWELGWKPLADYRTDALALPEECPPTKTIRAAVAAGIVRDGGEWMAAGRARNIISHTCSEASRDQTLADYIVRVDIFGSRARDTYRPGSDIDLVIVDDGNDDAYEGMLAALKDR